MKLTAILLTAAFLQVSASGGAQTISLSLKKASFDKVIKSIEKQSDFVFFFNNHQIQHAIPVTLSIENANIHQILKLVFDGQPFSYTLFDNWIVIKEKKAITLNELNSNRIEGQYLIDVKGKVLNEKGEPLSGATVSVKGKQGLTITDVNGSFSLNDINENSVIVVTYVGYVTQEIKLNSRSEINVILKLEVGELDQVTVSTGYQNIPKERATGSFEFVKNEDLSQRVGYDILSRLENVTTSVLFDRRSLSPNETRIDQNNIIIRGLSTLSSSIKAPLIVLNNFPFEGDINNINPNDIESITILKDAAAASIWGAKAGNGVVVITTKQGKYKQQARVLFNSNVIFTEKPDLYKYPQMSVSDFVDVELFLFNKGFYNNELNNSTIRPGQTPVIETLAKRKAGLITSSDSALQIDGYRTLDVRNEFEKYIYRNSWDQQYSLNVSGGSEKIKYFFSGGIDKNISTLVGDKNQRVTLRTGNTFKVINNVEVTLNLGLTSVEANNNSLGNIGNSNYAYRATPTSRNLFPYAQFADNIGNHLAIVKDYRFNYTDTAGAGKLLDWKFRPLDELELADNTNKQLDIVVNIGVNYNISKWLSATLDYQYQNARDVSRSFKSNKTYYTRNLVNLFTQIQGDNIINIIPAEGILDEAFSNLESKAGRAQLNFSNSGVTKHQINGLTGLELREVNRYTNGNRKYGYNSETLSYSAIDYINLYPQYGNRGNARIPNGDILNKTLDRFVSIYGNGSYTYDSRYILSASIRKDASNLFGVDINNKWQPFWSIGAAWNLSNEDFFKVKTLSYLKFRVTYGYQGNTNNTLSPYPLLIRFPSIYNFWTGQAYSGIIQPADPSLKWESISQFNIGIDFSGFNKRISGSIEFYEKRSNNLILSSKIEPTTGLEYVTRNSASLKGRGIDLTINSVNLRGKFNWQTDLLLSHVSNEVTDYLLDDKDGDRQIGGFLGNGTQILPVKGSSPYAIYSYPFAGLDPMTGDPLGYLGKNIISNDYREISRQSLDTANWIYHGSAIPTIFGFINNTFSYKGFSMRVSISYKFNYYFRKNTINYFALYRTGETHYDYSARWQQPGDEKYTTIPSMVYPLSNGRRDAFYANSSINVFKGDHIRLQYIRFSYDLNNIKLKNLQMSNVNFYILINNLGILWKANKADLDPDYNAGNSLFPPMKSIACGLKFSL